MAIIAAQLKKKMEVAEGTMAFYFERSVEYTAGQFMDFTLIRPAETDDEGDTRTFTIAAAPYEPDLMVATRMRDTAFKRVLRTAPLGTLVQLDGPFGKMTLHQDAARPAVFLAGGIGITPFRSIVFQACRDKAPHRLFLFYSNRRPEDTAFLEELRSLEKENPNFKLVATMTGMEKSARSWNGETTHVSHEMLRKYVADLKAPIYYIAGPPAMVAALTKVLRDSGVKQDIRVEAFAGY